MEGFIRQSEANSGKTDDRVLPLQKEEAVILIMIEFIEYVEEIATPEREFT